MKRLSLLLGVLLTPVLVSDAWAKRTSPKPVAPVVLDGVKYLAPNANGREGRIEARSEKTGKKLWDAVIYAIRIDPNLEEDVQWVFITGLAVRDNTLLVTNEKNEQYIFDLKTRKVTKANRNANLEPTPQEVDLELTSVLRRHTDVFAANSAGLFHADLATKKWRRLILPETMPIGGTFAQVPENSPLILYRVAKGRVLGNKAHKFGIFVSVRQNT
jgi:hypothetical protein